MEQAYNGLRAHVQHKAVRAGASTVDIAFPSLDQVQLIDRGMRESLPKQDLLGHRTRPRSLRTRLCAGGAVEIDHKEFIDQA
jgi:hypothetical protein